MNLEALEKSCIALSKQRSKKVLPRKKFKDLVSIFPEDNKSSNEFIFWDYKNFKDRNGDVLIVKQGGYYLWKLTQDAAVVGTIKNIGNKKVYDVPFSAFQLIQSIPSKNLEDVHEVLFKSTYQENLPGDDITFQHLSARDIACLLLRSPKTSKTWLNTLINDSKTKR